MKNSILIIALFATTLNLFGQTKPPVTKSTIPKYGSLAVDKNNGFFYGWSYDYDSQKGANEKALEECKKKGGNCSIVLSFSGEGCAAYRTIKLTEGTAYGWGVAKTKADADAIATAECKKRSNGKMPTNYVWACNSTTSAPLKEIFNAKDEIAGSEITQIGSSQSVCFTSDGKKLAVAGRDGKIRILSVPSYKLLLVIDVASSEYSNEIQQVIFSPDNKIIASGHGRGGKIHFWDVTSGILVKTFEKKWSDGPAFSFSPDGKLFVSEGGCSWNGSACPGKINIWDYATGNLLHELSVPNLNISSSNFSPDGKILATTGRDGSVFFWNPYTGSKISSFTANNESLSEGLFSPDGKTFATLSWDGDEKTKIWDVATGNNIKTFPSHGTYGESISFYGNSEKLITIGMNENMFLFNLTTGLKIATATNVNYWGLAIAPDGTIATAGAGGVQIFVVDDSGFKVVKTFTR